MHAFGLRRGIFEARIKAALSKPYLFLICSYTVIENNDPFSIKQWKETAKMNTEVIISLRSVTHAVKGKRLLLENGIRATVVKPSVSDEGCGYGLSVSASHVDAAADILQKNRIRIVKIVRM